MKVEGMGDRRREVRRIDGEGDERNKGERKGREA